MVVADLGGKNQVKTSVGDLGLMIFDEIRLERHQVDCFQRNARGRIPRLRADPTPNLGQAVALYPLYNTGEIEAGFLCSRDRYVFYHGLDFFYPGFQWRPAHGGIVKIEASIFELDGRNHNRTGGSAVPT